MITFNSYSHYLDLHFPTNTNGFGNVDGMTALILGNTAGMFGVVGNKEVRLDLTNTDVINNSYFNFFEFITNPNNKVYVISDKETVEYYKDLTKYIAEGESVEIRNLYTITPDIFIKANKLKVDENDKDEVYINIIKALGKKNMKFDYILMNPPYDGNLHLKIVEQVLPMLKDDKSICVNLSPSRALQDPLAKYKKSDLKKFEDTVFKYLYDFNIIDQNTASLMFNIILNTDLGVYTFNKKGGYDYRNIAKNQKLIDKVINQTKISFLDVIEKNKINGIRVRVNELQPLEATDGRNLDTNKWRHFIINPNTETYIYKDGYTKTGKYWSTLVNKGKYTKNIGEPLPLSIRYNKYIEAENFENFCKTTFMNGIKNLMQIDLHVPLRFFPYLGSTENPRTHKIGYESDWTNEDLCKVFGITGFISDTEAEPGSEWETIINTMKPYLE